MPVKKAVIPAAGLGTRFLPVTKSVPKELLPILDRPMLQYVVEEAVEGGVEEVIVVTAPGKEGIASYFQPSPALERRLSGTGADDLLDKVIHASRLADVSFVIQEEALGLGHAVLTAADAVGDEPFVVILPDDIVHPSTGSGQTGPGVVAQMAEIFDRTGSGVVAVEPMPWETVHNYGVVDAIPVSLPELAVSHPELAVSHPELVVSHPELAVSHPELVEGCGVHKIRGLVEKPAREEAPSNLSIVGRYILPPGIFDCLERTPPGAKGEIQLTDGMLLLMENSDLYAYEFKGTRYDGGTPLGLLRASLEYALRREDTREAARDLLRSIDQG